MLPVHRAAAANPGVLYDPVAVGLPMPVETCPARDGFAPSDEIL